ncbi:hypothetical protein AcV5_002523 [Taiwanofungus camphoratus]|nr:hypothetical protein AcV5_002523 [Antrodia cinnamomea]
MYPVITVQRYERNVVLPRTQSSWIIEPLKTLYSLENVPSGWVACTHPEGALYFFNPVKRIYTDAYLCDPKVLYEVSSFGDAINDLLQRDSMRLPVDTELVLELEDEGEGEYKWCYYFVCHHTRTLFWLHEHDVSEYIDSVTGVRSPAHLKHQIEYYYWMHWDYFPYGHKARDSIFDEITGILVHADLDQMTSATSTVTYSADDLHKMLTVVQNAREIGNDQQQTICIVGRLMCIFAYHRFLNFHGVNGARLSRDQSVYGESKSSRSPLITLLSPLLFNAPEVHLRGLDSIWVDSIICILPWGQFIERLQTDWQEYILYATVLLNANVAFLTVPDVDPGKGPRTSAQIASFVSIIASIGSIIIGLLLVRHYRVKPKDTADDATNYLLSRRHPTLGLETLAITYSLPYALLMWAMVTFLVAFAFECFLKHDDASTYTSAVFWILVGLLVVWCIYTVWEGNDTPALAWSSVRSAWEGALRECQRVSESLKWDSVFSRGRFTYGNRQGPPPIPGLASE